MCLSRIHGSETSLYWELTGKKLNSYVTFNNNLRHSPVYSIQEIRYHFSYKTFQKKVTKHASI